MAAAVVTAGVLHAMLPEAYRVQPRWAYPAVLLALLVALILGDPGRIDRQVPWLRWCTGAVIGLVTLVNCLSAGRLVLDILDNSKIFANHPGTLLGTGAIVWSTNVIAFGLWFWDLDRGGAAARAHGGDRPPALIFPEMLHPGLPRGWMPAFVDYLFVSFNTATAFSPTDVSAVKPWAKVLMMLESAVSLAVGTLVIARAINVL